MRKNQTSEETARVAIYARYSSENQATDSADTQIQRARRKLSQGAIQSRLYSKRELSIDEYWVIKDEARTGTTVGRDGYQRILDGVRNKSFDLLLVDDLSRLTRDLGDMLELYELARYNGVEIFSVCEGLSSSDDSAKTAFTIRGLVNDWANEGHRNRVIGRMETHFINGFSTGHLPYGYTSTPTDIQERKGRREECRCKIIIHEERAAVVIRIFEMSAEGLGQRKIAAILNEELIASPARSHRDNGRIGGWTASSIQGILSNPRYIGEWTFRETSIVKNPLTGKKSPKSNRPEEVIKMDPEIAAKLRIVPKDLWNIVAEQREQTIAVKKSARTKGQAAFGDRQGRNTADYLMSGLLRCCECGSNLVLGGGKNGGYYGCSQALQGNQSCENKALIPRKKLESAIIDALAEMLSQKAWLKKLAMQINEGLASAQVGEPGKRRDIKKEISRLDREIENFVAFIAKGNSSEAVTSRLTACERRKTALETELHKLAVLHNQREKVTAERLRPYLKGILQRIAEQPLSSRSEMKRLFPGGITLTPPKDRRRGPWRADLKLDSSKVLFVETYRVRTGETANSQTIKPPEESSEGSEFSERSFGSC